MDILSTFVVYTRKFKFFFKEKCYMKKYNLLKLVALAFVAGVCTSGQTPNTANQELAMTRCTKPANDDSSDDTRGRRRSDGGCGRCTSEVENQKKIADGYYVLLTECRGL